MKCFYSLIFIFLFFKGYAQKSYFDWEKHFEIFVGGNYNFTASEMPALTFSAFYDINDPKYFEFNKYYPLLEQLNWMPTSWKISPQPSLGFRFYNLINDQVGFGLNFTLTRNVFEALVVSEVDQARAKLSVTGREFRALFEPTQAFFTADKRGFGYLNFTFGLGFSKDYHTQLEINEEGKVTQFKNDDDYFYSVDYSLGGGGGGFNYRIYKSFNLGIQYNIYRVNTSPNKSLGTGLGINIPDPIVNGYWNQSVSLSLGYLIL